MNVREAIRVNPMTRFQWTVVAICIMLTVIDGYEILITAFTLPALTAEWDLSLAQQGLIASIGTLGMGVGAVALSPLADRIGRRRHILFSLGLIVVGMAASGLAPNFTAFLAARFFAGLFLGGIIPAINVLVCEYASEKRRGTAMGVYGVGLPLGAALGGFLSIWLIDAFGWQGPYFFSAVVTAVLLVLAVVALPESVGYLVERRPQGALAAYNRIATKLGLPQEATLPARSAGTARSSLREGACQGVMARRTILLWLSYGLLIASFYFANSFTAKLVAQSTGSTDIGIIAQALVAAGGVVGALAFAALSSRIHPRLVTAMVLAFGTLAFFAFANFFTVTSLVMVLAVMVGIAANGGLAAYHAISPTIYPAGVRTTAVGMMMGFGRAVAFLAPNLAALLLARGFTPSGVYQFYGVALAVASVTVWALHRTYRGADALDAMQLEAVTEPAATAAAAR